MNTVFKIRELRKRAGLTQAELVQKLGIQSESTMSMWENGLRNPPSTMLQRLAKVLGCTIDELFWRDQDIDQSYTQRTLSKAAERGVSIEPAR